MTFNSRALAVCVMAAVASVPSGARAQSSPVDTLRWMTGCWRMTSPRVTIDEQWMAPSGGVMLGMSRTVAGGREREHEFIRLYASGDTLVYAANPSGQKPTEFRAPPSAISPTEIVFANPAHDFPQRVRYRRASGDSLIATVEGDRGGRVVVRPFPYLRVACAPEATP